MWEWWWERIREV